MKKRILIVEDHGPTREAMTMAAMTEGYEVVPVADGLEYLAAVSKENFDLILTDLMMPDLNGVSATEIMKIKGDNTLVVAITGLSDHDIKHTKERFTKVFHKPVNTVELFGYIKTLL